MHGKNETVSIWPCWECLTNSLGRALANPAQREGIQHPGWAIGFLWSSWTPNQKKKSSCTTHKWPFPTSGKGCGSSQPSGKPRGAGGDGTSRAHHSRKGRAQPGAGQGFIWREVSFWEKDSVSGSSSQEAFHQFWSGVPWYPG